MKRLFSLISCSIVLPLVLWVGGILAAQPEWHSASIANRAFTFHLYKKLAAKDRATNIFLSPYSISTALTMTYAGARGSTAEEMASVFHYGVSGAEIHKAFQTLMEGIGKSSKEGCRLYVANALWGQEGYGFKTGFLNLVARYYSGGFNQVDFIGESEKTRLRINGWAEQNTAGKIENLIGSDDIDSDTRLVLTNAIYFKGEWTSQFEKELTQKRPFYLEPEKAVDVEMMFKFGKLRYYAPSEEQERPVSEEVTIQGRPAVQNQGIQILELPYTGDDLSMVILLSSEGVERIEAAIDSKTLTDWLSRLGERDVRAFIPKFKFQSKYYLKEMLESLGMRQAFTERADFSGMTGRKDLRVSKVIHQADIDVNEEGTEAAAATAVVTSKLVSMLPERPVVIFKADRPFLFLIRHRPTNTILFIGRVANPNLQ
ncbi:MAG: serpin family protein [Desulfobacterales bacterium]|nr:serpin family protein [Desulfobacterales bacterium]